LNDLQALRGAIAKDWDEDTPRLAYADALDETGDRQDARRAAFIRLSCERARESKEARESPEGKKREAQYQRLAKRLRYHYKWPLGDYRFDRGFVLALACTSAEWQKRGPNLRHSDPAPLRFGVFLTAAAEPLPAAEENPGIVFDWYHPTTGGIEFSANTRAWSPSFGKAPGTDQLGRMNDRAFNGFPCATIRLERVDGARTDNAAERRFVYRFRYYAKPADPVAAAIEEFNRLHVHGVTNMADAIVGEFLEPMPGPDEIKPPTPRNRIIDAARRTHNLTRDVIFGANFDIAKPYVPPRSAFVTRPYT